MIGRGYRGTQTINCPASATRRNGSLCRFTAIASPRNPAKQRNPPSHGLTTETRLRGQGAVGAEVRRGAPPTPPPSLGSCAPVPALSWGARRGDPPQPCPRPGTAGASQRLPPHFSRGRWMSSSSSLQQQAWDRREEEGAPRAQAPQSPRPPRPGARGARGPTPERPLTRGGSEAGARRSAPSPVATATAFSRSWPRRESGRGGGCYSRLKGEEETETGTAAAA